MKAKMEKEFKMIKQIYKELGADHLPDEVLIKEIARRGYTAEEAKKLVYEADEEIIARVDANYKGKFYMGYSLLTPERKKALEDDQEIMDKWLMKKVEIFGDEYAAPPKKGRRGHRK